MSSELVRLEFSPIVKAMTLAVLKTIKNYKISYEKREIINADLVPRVPERVVRPMMMMPSRTVGYSRLAILPPHRQFTQQQTKMMPSHMTSPAQGSMEIPNGDYGKITGFLNDISVTYIECQGAGKPLTIIRQGQKQFTRISLNPLEIKKLLEQIAEKVHVPLIEGVFKAAVDNFVINAVVSDIIGSRFIIKKQTPYSLLER